MKMKILLHDFCDNSSYFKGFTPATIRRYNQVVNCFIRKTGAEEIGDLNEDAVRKYFLDGRVKSNWSSNSFITYHKTLAVFFRWCVQKGYMKTNLTDDIEIPKLAKKLPPKLTRQEAMKLLEVVYNYPYKYKYLRYRNHAIFSIILFAGLRKKEVLNLKLTDVDLENYSIFVSQGKGSKDRIIPMCTKLADILTKYLVERKRLKKTCPEFFTSLNRDMKLSDVGIRRLVDKMRITSRIKFSLHKLRHSFATLMLEGGCDIFSLSKMMGHSDIKTTTIYLAATAEHLRSQMVKHPLNSI